MATRNYRPDDLRRFAAALAVGAGMTPASASVLATRLLWFDAAGASAFGIASLPGLLERIGSGAIDPSATPVIVSEHGGTATLDGRRAVPLVVLDRAAGLATEKGRETGVGLVRVENLPAPGPTAGIPAEITVAGPYVGFVIGPGASWSLALPVDGGLPAVWNPDLAPNGSAKPRGGKRPVEFPSPFGAPLAAWLLPPEGCLVGAVLVPALESLSAFQERIAAFLEVQNEANGRLLPEPWEARRRAVRAAGVPVSQAGRNQLERYATAFQVPLPEPLPQTATPPHSA